MTIEPVGVTFNSQTPLYNSRIAKVYLEYLEKYYPELNIDTVLQKIKLQRYEIEDPGHWFNQTQMDLFHEILVDETGNPALAREAGRFAAQSKEIGPLKQYALGLINPAAMFLFMETIYPLMSRGAILSSKKTGNNKVEIVARPTIAEEKVYQCQNRIGFFESIVHLFTDGKVTIEHPECFHQGQASCRYLVKWDYPPSFIWKRIFFFSLSLGIPALLAVFYLLPLQLFTLLLAAYFLAVLSLSGKKSSLEMKELLKIIENQGKSAQDHLQEINRRYDYAMLFQKIGQLTSSVRKSSDLTEAVSRLFEKYFDFEMGMIHLIDPDKKRLQFQSGFGLSEQMKNKLGNFILDLDSRYSTLPVIGAIRDKNLAIIDRSSTKSEQQWLESIGLSFKQPIKTCIYVPIVYESNALGVVSFLSYQITRPTTESDVNLLKGVVSQLAIGISNAKSYQDLKESEEKYRTLIETTNTGFVVISPTGLVLDANDEYVRLTGYYTLDEIKGRDVISWTAESDVKRYQQEFQKCQQSGFIKNFAVSYKSKNGYLTPIEMNGAIVSIDNRSCILTTCRDMTEQKRSLEILIQTEKMTTVGALAAGMAHELNNPLAGILQTLQVLKNRLTGNSPRFNQIAEKYGLAVGALSSFHEEMGALEKIEAILDTGQYAAEIVRNMVNFSQNDQSHFSRHDIASLLDKSVEIAKSDYNLKLDYDFKDIEIIREYDPTVPRVPCAASRIQQVFLSILKNGAQELLRSKNPNSSPRFVLRVSREMDNAKIEIEDNGPGMKESVRKRIFEPFFSTRQVGTGTGLGLSLAYFIISENHGGNLFVETTPGKGTRFIIKLPLFYYQKD